MNVTAESKSQPPSGCDEPPGKVDQFLNDGLDPSALGRVTNDPFAGYQADLTNKPEDILYTRAVQAMTSWLVANLPEGNLSRSMLFAVFIGGAMPLHDTEDRHPFSRTGSFHRPFGKGLSLPCLGVLLAGVLFTPFYL